MKAIVHDTYGSADVLEIRDIDPPEICDDDVLVRVRAAGLDPGVWHLMTGLPYLIRIMGYGFRTPKNRVPGSDFSGRVEAVGPNVTRCAVGEEVFGIGHGTFAEYARASEGKIASKPSNLTFEQSAAVPVSAITALQGLRDHGKIQAGQSVLIIGASGGVGTFAVQLAKVFGAEVTGVCSTNKVELVRSIGADHVIDYTRQDFRELRRRYDLILDTAGARPLRLLRSALSTEGTLVFVGAEGGNRLTGGIGRQLRGAMLSPFVRHNLRMYVASANREDLQLLKEHIEAGRVRPVIDRTCPLDETPDAVRYLAQGHTRGKVVISVTQST